MLEQVQGVPRVLIHLACPVSSAWPCHGWDLPCWLPAISYKYQFSSVAQSCLTPCDPMNHSTPGLPAHHQLPEFTQTYVHKVGDAIQPSHPRSAPSPPAPNPSQHQSLSNELTLCMRWTKYWSFSFNISPSNEHSGQIFRMNQFDVLAVQETLKSCLQHYSSKASIFQHSAFFIVQLSHPYMTTWKNHSFDYMDLCKRNNVSSFKYTV